MNTQPPIADIVIVGAGLVGVPLAQVLAVQGWQVVLLDAGGATDQHATNNVDTELSSDQNALRQRCTALSLGTQRWFARHQLWSLIAMDAAPIKQVCVSHKGYFGATRLSADELGAEAVGFVVNNTHLTQSLMQALRATTVHHRINSRVLSVSHHAEHVEIHVEQGAPVKARLLIAADGASSVVRESVGIHTRQVDYDQVASLGTLKLNKDHNGIAYERFTPSGPLALLPRTGRYMSFVDCMDPEDQDYVAQLDSERFLARLQSRFGYRLGRFAAVGPRVVTPLLRIEATSQIAERTVLLGNAARLLHPVGGQGYNLAMRDLAELMQILGAHRDTDPGQSQLLERFVRARQSDQQQIVKFTDVLARAFRGQATLPAHIRSAALLGLDITSPLRNRFARRTMGL